MHTPLHTHMRVILIIYTPNAYVEEYSTAAVHKLALHVILTWNQTHNVILCSYCTPAIGACTYVHLSIRMCMYVHNVYMFQMMFPSHNLICGLSLIRCCPASVPLLQQPHSLLQQHCWPHLPLPWCVGEGEWTAQVHCSHTQLESEWRLPLPWWGCV